MLGVDAVVFGDVHLVKPMSQEESNIINGIVGFGVAPSNKVKLELSIYDAESNLRWSQIYIGRGNVEDEEIIKAVMKKVSKRFTL